MATITKRVGKYQVQIRRQGHPSQSKNFVYLADAKKWALKVERDLDVGPQFAPAVSKQFSFFELADRFDQVVIDGLKSVARERSRLWLMKDRLGDVPVSEIDAEYLYRDSRTDLVSSQTIKHEVNMIRRVLRFGIQECGLRLADGVPVIRLAKLPRGRSRRLLKGEYESLMENLAAEMRDVVDLALETGMRRSELLKLRPEHISSSNKLVRVIDPKNGVDRNIPLTGKAFEIVSARLGDDSVFSIQPDNVTKSFLKACRAADITGLRFHDLRHEAISRFFEEGLSVAQVASISGHSDYRMLARYAHLRPFSRSAGKN
jgi:integrase